MIALLPTCPGEFTSVKPGSTAFDSNNFSPYTTQHQSHRVDSSVVERLVYTVTRQIAPILRHVTTRGKPSGNGILLVATSDQK